MGKRRMRREALLDHYLSTYAPKKKTEADRNIVCRNCKNCNNKYCYCLQRGYFCDDRCKCKGCRNKEEFITEIRAELRAKLLKRFKGKEAQTIQDIKDILEELWNRTSCNCKGACDRNYCSCR